MQKNLQTIFFGFAKFCTFCSCFTFVSFHSRCCVCVATLTCRWDKLVLSSATIIAEAGADGLFLLLVCDNSLSGALENGLNDNRILIDLQLLRGDKKEKRRCTHTRAQKMGFASLQSRSHLPQQSQNGGCCFRMKGTLWLHLRALQVVSLSIVTQQENILFQIAHTPVFVVAHAFL